MGDRFRRMLAKKNSTSARNADLSQSLTRPEELTNSNGDLLPASRPEVCSFFSCFPEIPLEAMRAKKYLNEISANLCELSQMSMLSLSTASMQPRTSLRKKIPISRCVVAPSYARAALRQHTF